MTMRLALSSKRQGKASSLAFQPERLRRHVVQRDMMHPSSAFQVLYSARAQ